MKRSLLSRFVNSLQPWIGFIAVIGCLALAISVRDASSFFQECVSQKATKEATQQRIESSTRVPVLVIDRWPISMACTGDYLNTNNPAINAIGTMVIAIFTIILVTVSRQQYTITRETLIADKRSYVFASGINPRYELVGDAYYWRFQTRWKNTGHTATRNLQLNTHCEVRNSELPETYSFDAVVPRIGG